MSAIDEYSSRHPSAADALFLERLETFMEKCLADIKAFSERELRPFEETRRTVAEWHAKHLFHPSASQGMSFGRTDYVRSVLIDTAQVLESLSETAGVQSLFLAIDPGDEKDGGFLGGSLSGREFWRGLRGGGDYGAKAFKNYCLKNEPEPKSSETNVATSPAGAGTSSRLDSKSVKSDLYDTVRRALKSVSGVRNAEMKWINPERLDMYGVRLVGWPPSIPSQNPSTLKLSQNKQLLDAFKDGTARFERLPTSLHPLPLLPDPQALDSADDDFSWAYDPEASPKVSAKSPMPTSVPTGLLSPRRAPPGTSSTRENTSGAWNLYNSSLMPRDSSGEDLDGDARCRKRPRSEEPRSEFDSDGL